MSTGSRRLATSTAPCCPCLTLRPPEESAPLAGTRLQDLTPEPPLGAGLPAPITAPRDELSFGPWGSVRWRSAQERPSPRHRAALQRLRVRSRARLATSVAGA